MALIGVRRQKKIGCEGKGKQATVRTVRSDQSLIIIIADDNR